MSDYIPFDIQSEIIKRLPVKSLVKFRSASKQWKSFVDCPEFVKTYHINHPSPRQHLLVQYRYVTFTSIIDVNTFPNQKFPLTPPKILTLLSERLILGFVDGLLAFYGWHIGLKHHMVVLWNPSIRKSVGIPVPNVSHRDDYLCYTRIGFAVCRDTNDPTLVKINVVKNPSISWKVQVFTLRSRVWKTVYTGAPFKSRSLNENHVFLDGIIYWSAHPNSVISFDLKSEKFGEVFLSERLLRLNDLRVVKVNGSLGLLEYYKEGDMWVCGVWMWKDGDNKPFTKTYTIMVEGRDVFHRVLGFRNSGEVVLAMDDVDDIRIFQIEVYEPLSGRISNLGISGDRPGFRACSYMETLLLLDQSNSIIQ